MATDFTSKDISELYSENIVSEEKTLKPLNLSYLKDIKGKKVIDLGCGNGKYSIYMAKKGASVVAIDSSNFQIDIAKKRNKHQNIQYKVGDGSDLFIIEDNSIDLVFMNMVVPDLEGKDEFYRSVKEVARVLRKDGTLLFTVLHPLYICSDQDPTDMTKEFKKENYFKDGHYYHSEAITERGNIITFNETHFSLTEISRILHENRFAIIRLKESLQFPAKGIYLPKYLLFECRPISLK